jgi:hypothetical protein
MGERKSGGYIFRTRSADHPPLHVHIYDGQNRLVGKWNVEQQEPMGDFVVSRRLRKALWTCGYLREHP